MAVIPLRFFEVPEVFDDHDVPLDDERMIPDSPTIINVLFAKVILLSLSEEIPPFREVHEVPPHEVRIFAPSPTTTNELFAYVTPLSELEEPEVL